MELIPWPLLANRYDIAPWWGALAGMLLAALLAYLWGFTTFRLRGSYFTLSSIAVAEILRLVAIQERWLTQGAEGIFLFSLKEPFGLDLFERKVQYYLALGFLAIVIALVLWLSRAKFGYYMRAVRENEESAQAAGINPRQVKLQAFMLSGALTALGGAIYAVYLSYLEPHDIFFLPLSVQIALTAIIGGRSTLYGPLSGALLLVLSQELFRSVFAEANLLIYGVLIVLVVLFVPRGMLGQLSHMLVRRRYVRSRES
ncbi:MAG: branched-chain amino acid ABC transporter permease [Deinococcales bacterium]